MRGVERASARLGLERRRAWRAVDVMVGEMVAVVCTMAQGRGSEGTERARDGRALGG